MREIFDLSHGLDEDTFHPFGFPSFKNVQGFASHGCRHAIVTMSLHSGTHIDAPWHMVEAGKRLDQMSIGELAGPAVIVDLSAAYGPENGSASREISQEALDKALSSCGEKLAPGDALIVFTGWAPLFHSEPSRYYDRYRILSGEACDWLARIGVRLVGIDSPDFDTQERYQSAPFDPVNHRKLLGRGVYVIENVGGEVAGLAGERVFLIPAPLKIRGEYASGAPLRLLAMRFEKEGSLKP
jgi:arylformamidase